MSESNRDKNAGSTFPVRLLVDVPGGAVALGPETARRPLPSGPDAPGPRLEYGPYLNSLLEFFRRDSYASLIEALRLHTGRAVTLDEILRLDITSVKHGAIYHVARVTASLEERTCRFAVNVAVGPDRQALLETEFELLQGLYSRFALPWLPRAYLHGETAYSERDGSNRTLALFIAKWFEGYHEFHLSAAPGEERRVIRVWNDREGNPILNEAQTNSLYSKASFILTSYLDGRSFQQIHPWHHAAGDFVVRVRENEVDLRMVTARGYRSLTNTAGDPEESWIDIVHFFLNLTLRMRIDRLDGTGELAWADAQCLQGVVSGFFDAWGGKAARDASLPSVESILEVFELFDREEWLDLARIIAEQGRVEESEIDFIGPRLEEHVDSLRRVLRDRTQP